MNITRALAVTVLLKALRVTRHIFLLLPLIATMVVVHEAGHVIAIKFSVPIPAAVYVWPGYQLYPDFGGRYPGTWRKGSVAVTQIIPVERPVVLGNTTVPGLAFGSTVVQPRTQTIDVDALSRAEPFIQLAGTGSTLVLSVLSLLALTLLRPHGVWRGVLCGGALMHLDLLSYAVLPTLFGVQHLVFFGGSSSEPVLALVTLGVPAAVSVSGSVALSVLLLFWLYRQRADATAHLLPTYSNRTALSIGH